MDGPAQQHRQQHELLRGGHAARLLASLPAASRGAVRTFEVAAVLQQQSVVLPAAPAAVIAVPRCFLLAVVTDTHVVLVSLRGGPPLLELPLAGVADVRDAPARDLGGSASSVLDDAAATSARISLRLFGGGAGDDDGGGDGDAPTNTAAAADSEEAQASSSGGGGGGLLAGLAAVLVPSRHRRRHAAAAAAAAAMRGRPDCHLELVTVERRSVLAFHLRAAWVGCHTRTALAAAAAAAAAAGSAAAAAALRVPAWLPLPAACGGPEGPGGNGSLADGAPPWALQQPAAGRQPHGKQQQAPRCEGASLPSMTTTTAGSDALTSSNELPHVAPLEEEEDEVEEEEEDNACASRSSSPPPGRSRPMMSLGRAGGSLGAGGQRRRQQQQQQQQRASGFYGAGGAAAGGGGGGGGVRGLVRAVCAQPSCSATRELLWDQGDALLRPSALLGDAADAAALRRLLTQAHLCHREQLPALHAALFASPAVLAFAAERLAAWGVLMGAFAPGLPPIQNPAQPGRLDAWRGRPVVWATALLYPGRPRRLLRRLGLAPSGRVALGRALGAAAAIAARRRAAAAAAEARARGGGGGSGGSLRLVPLGAGTWHADPLNLSPLGELHYSFMAAAKRMAAPARLTARSDDSEGDSSDDDHGGGGNGDGGSGSDDVAAGGTLAEATAALRWERLVGRLCARAAAGKSALLLRLLATLLPYSEGCAQRAAWLSSRPLAPAPATGGAVAAASHQATFLAATRQLLVCLLALHLPPLAAAGAAVSGPRGVDDLLWWAAPGSSSSSSSSSGGSDAAIDGGGSLDALATVLHSLLGLCEQHAGGSSTDSSSGGGAPCSRSVVLEAARAAPRAQLCELLRRVLLRLVCLLSGCNGGGGGQQEPLAAAAAAAGAAMAARHAGVLLALLDGVAGAADGLHDDLAVELRHLLATPQVAAVLGRVAASAAAVATGTGSSGGSSCRVLTRLAMEQLAEAAARVGAAVPWARVQGGLRARVADGLAVTALVGGGGGAGAHKVGLY